MVYLKLERSHTGYCIIIFYILTPASFHSCHALLEMYIWQVNRNIPELQYMCARQHRLASLSKKCRCTVKQQTNESVSISSMYCSHWFTDRQFALVVYILVTFYLQFNSCRAQFQLHISAAVAYRRQCISSSASSTRILPIAIIFKPSVLHFLATSLDIEITWTRPSVVSILSGAIYTDHGSRYNSCSHRSSRCHNGPVRRLCSQVTARWRRGLWPPADVIVCNCVSADGPAAGSRVPCVSY